MTVLVTGAAGFIGFHVALALAERGERVVGIDNLDPYYDVALKKARLTRLEVLDGFSFRALDITDGEGMDSLVADNPDITRVVHLAAQAGVRYSLIDPFAYTRVNIDGHLTVIDACRRLARLDHLVFASSSSVYGGNEKMPFSVADRVDTPVSLYAASKKAVELISHAYSHLHGMPQTGLRFFTVYGPWGRPDMAAFIFTQKILAGEVIPVFNHGDMRRDFTYIDDVVDGILACLDNPPKPDDGRAPYRVYNVGNSRSEPLMRFIGLIEDALDRKAEFDLLPMQPGDIKETYADISDTQRDFGFTPQTAIDEGIPRFVAWYRDYHGL
jgi:UDP-glucuronate 4-epimerase